MKKLPPAPPMALLEKATELTTARLVDDPSNGELLHKLAVLFRKQGRLAEAAEVYSRVLKCDPTDSAARYNDALLGSQNVAADVPPSGKHAAPFVMIEDFLPPEEHAELLPMVISNQAEFGHSLVGEGEYRPETRESRTLPGPRQEKKRFRERVNRLLPEVTSRLGLSPFPINFVEIKIRAYGNGDFFEVHQDHNDETHREVSFVYFFHREPRQFQGGDLLLMDTDPKCRTYTEAAFTSITPRNNAIVFFPSRYYHTVVPVDCPSGEFSDGRFVINGHVQKEVSGNSKLETVSGAA